MNAGKPPENPVASLLRRAAEEIRVKVASLPPAVAEALAGWLEDDAERARLSMGHFDGKDCCDGQPCVHRHAPGFWHDGGEDAEWSCNDPWTGGEDGCTCFAGAVATARAWLRETGTEASDD